MLLLVCSKQVQYRRCKLRAFIGRNPKFERFQRESRNSDIIMDKVSRDSSGAVADTPFFPSVVEGRAGIGAEEGVFALSPTVSWL